MLLTVGGLIIGAIAVAIVYAWWAAIRGFKRKRKEWAAIDRLKRKTKR